MPTYDPAGSELLSAAAQRLEAGEFAAQADAAEAALDAALAGRGYGALTDTSFKAGAVEYDRAVIAIALQVNYQVEAGAEAEVVGTSRRGDRQVSFRGGVLNPFPTVSPRALAIALQLVSGPSSRTWPTAGGVR